MSTATCGHEIRGLAENLPFGTNKQRFQAIDAYVREYERILREWPTLAKLCLEVKRDKLWKYGGHAGYQEWLVSALPTCERKVRYATSLYESLHEDFSDGELSEIPVETAKVLSKISKASRRDPKVREAVKEKREKFVKTLAQVRPDEHIEPNITRTFTYEASQWEKIQQAMEMYRRIQNPNASEAEIQECWAVNYLIENTQAMGAEA